MTRWSGLAAALGLIVAAACGGCGTYQGTGGIPGSPLDRLPSVVIDIPARQAGAAVRPALAEPPLSLTVESDQDGILVTSWKEYPGTVHIVRRWPERTRFFIIINPDFNEPARKSRIFVYDQSQELADSRKGWFDNPQLYRRERSDAVLHAIERHINGTASPTQ